jgi:hypothetical protein
MMDMRAVEVYLYLTSAEQHITKGFPSSLDASEIIEPLWSSLAPLEDFPISIQPIGFSHRQHPPYPCLTPITQTLTLSGAGSSKLSAIRLETRQRVAHGFTNLLRGL